MHILTYLNRQVDNTSMTLLYIKHIAIETCQEGGAFHTVGCTGIELIGTTHLPHVYVVGLPELFEKILVILRKRLISFNF